MAEYIRREDVLSIINASCFDLEYNSENIALQEEIKLIPAADVVERKKGKWIHFSRSDECSVCGYDTGKYEAPTWFCPNCGADMRGET